MVQESWDFSQNASESRFMKASCEGTKAPNNVYWLQKNHKSLHSQNLKTSSPFVWQRMSFWFLLLHLIYQLKGNRRSDRSASVWYQQSPPGQRAVKGCWTFLRHGFVGGNDDEVSPKERVRWQRTPAVWWSGFVWAWRRQQLCVSNAICCGLTEAKQIPSSVNIWIWKLLIHTKRLKHPHYWYQGCYWSQLLWIPVINSTERCTNMIRTNSCLVEFTSGKRVGRPWLVD